MRQGRDRLVFALAIWGLGLALPVALAQDVQPQEAPGKKAGWLSRFWPGASPTNIETAEEHPEAKPTIQARDLAHEHYRTEYFRREAVCGRLQEIAQLTGDQKLAQEAEALEQFAWEIYLKQTGLEQTPLTGASSDEKRLAGAVGGSWEQAPEESFQQQAVRLPGEPQQALRSGHDPVREGER
jgi:hypothetical protein